MPVNLVSDDELRAALRPYRVDPATFEAGVRTRLEAAQRQRADDPLAGRSPFLRSAAAFLPLAILAGCKASPAESKLAPAAGGYKLLSYLAFPAISLFVLLGATVFSVVQIRNSREQNGSRLSDEQVIQEAIREWWSRNRRGAISVFVASVILGMVGATWLLFLFYILSFGILLGVLASYAKLGVGNRQMIGQSCLMGLVFLGQMAAFSGIGMQEIHFVDQTLVAAIFFGGTLILLPVILVSSPAANVSGQRMGAVRRRMIAVMYSSLVVLLMTRMMNPILWPATPTRIKHFVESFDHAPYESSSWQQWEVVAKWAIQSKLDPDLSKPRELLAKEISGKQNPFILSNALRVGLLPADQLDPLKDYQELRRSLVDAPLGLKPQVITSLDQHDWVIRAAVLRNDLSPQGRDLLEQRLHATLENLFEVPQVVLSDPLRATQLLEVLGRPVNRDQYRARVHDLLRKFHSTSGGGFQLAGGFKTYLTWPAESWMSQPGSLEPTAYAVELMEIYGVPDDLDLHWVRSFLKPTASRPADDKWVAAAIRERLNHLPGVTPPTWLEFLYYERCLLAAAVLVGLCFYATISSPKRKAIDSVEGS